MLTVISDLHLNDGTVCKQTSQTSAKLFFDSLKTQAEKARKRSEYESRPLDEINIIMNGDIFDFIRSDSWFSGSSRPWDNIEKIYPIVKTICDNIIQNNEEFLNTFKHFAKNGILLDGDTSPTKVNIYYIVGNHDWFLYVKNKKYNKLRKTVIDAFGLNQKSFYWQIEHNPIILRKCIDHNVYIRHGDKYDEYNYHEFLGRGASSIGDAIAVELVTGFPNLAISSIYKKYPNDKIPQNLIDALEELDNIRPSIMVPVFINNIISTITPKKYKDILKCSFHQCIKNIERSKIFEDVFENNPMLCLKLKLIQFASKYAPTTLIRFVSKLSSVPKDSYQLAAANERYIRNNKCKYVVYGHTHFPEIKGIGMFDNEPMLYFNSSTWRTIHEEIDIGKSHKNKLPYFTYDAMTWINFYKDGERCGKQYEIWNGKRENDLLNDISKRQFKKLHYIY